MIDDYLDLDNFLFRTSCENGFIVIVTWLLENSKNPINIKTMNEYPFRISKNVVSIWT